MIKNEVPTMPMLFRRTENLTVREVVYRGWHGPADGREAEGETEGKHLVYAVYVSDGTHALVSLITYHPRFADCDAVVMFAPVKPHGEPDWRTVDTIPADEWFDAVTPGIYFQYAPPTRVQALARTLMHRGAAIMGLSL
jgi:hypothetical protein